MIKIDPSIRDKIETGCLIWLSGRIKSNLSSEVTKTILKGAVSEAKERYRDEKPQNREEISQTRKAYKALGKDPSRYRCAGEALARRALNGKSVDTINALTDLNNIMSLRSGFSIGAYDTKKINGSVFLRKAGPDDAYDAIGRGTMNLENLPVLCDLDGPFGSPTSDSIRTMTNDGTTDFFMVVFAFGYTSISEEQSSLIHSSLAQAEFETIEDQGQVSWP